MSRNPTVTVKCKHIRNDSEWSFCKWCESNWCMNDTYHEVPCSCNKQLTFPSCKCVWTVIPGVNMMSPGTMWASVDPWTSVYYVHLVSTSFMCSFKCYEFKSLSWIALQPVWNNPFLAICECACLCFYLCICACINRSEHICSCFDKMYSMHMLHTLKVNLRLRCTIWFMN